MYKHKQNSKALAIVVVALLVLIGAFISILPEEATNAGADVITVDSDFFYPLEGEKTEVFISLSPSYELLYKGTSYIEENGGTYYTDAALFAALEFEDIMGTPIIDLTAGDIVVTGITEIKDVDTYSNVTFAVSASHETYYGTLITTIDVSPKSLGVEIAALPYIYYGQTLASTPLVYTGFVAGETASSLVSSNALIEPTINNVNAVSLDPANNGTIIIELNNDGSADNYTLNIDVTQKSLIINKARVSISLDGGILPYIYMDYIDGSNPVQDLFDEMSFTNTDISQPVVSGIARTDIVIVSPLALLNAGDYDITTAIDGSNIYYTISPSQTALEFSISKAVFNYINSSNISGYFSYDDEKAYDATTHMSISVAQPTINGINSEIITITGAVSEYASKDAGTRNYTVTYTINSTNYTVEPVLMDGALSGTILSYDVTDTSALRFLGIRLQREYDTTLDMPLYDRVYFVRNSFMTVFNYLSAKIQTEYGLSLSDSQQFVNSLTCFVGDQATDPYIVLRIDKYAALNLFYDFLNDAQDANFAIAGLLGGLDFWLDSQVYDYDSYNGDGVADLFFTELNEVVQLSDGASHIFGQYDSKDAVTELVTSIGYYIDYNGFSHSNYTLPGVGTVGADGIIMNATIGVDYPTLEKIYGQPNPTDIYVPFVDTADLAAAIGMPVTPDGNVIYLPLAARSAISLDNYMYFNRLLTDFYASDLSEPEVAAMLSGDELYYVYDVDTNVYNVYTSYADYLIGKQARYNLSAFLPIKNYNFLAILSLYDSSYSSSPGLQVNPVDTVIDTADIELSKEYSRDENTDFSNAAVAVTTPSFIDGEETLFYLEITAHFIDALGDRVNHVASSLRISDFVFMVRYFEDYTDYSQDQLNLMSCNYRINVKSLCDIIDAISGVSLEVFVETEEIWVSYSDYNLLYNTRNILDCRISEAVPDTISITEAQLLIRIGDGQSFYYGNDILSGLIIEYENFYQENPGEVFDVTYLIKTIFGAGITHEENNALPTGLIPSEDAYNMTLSGYSVIDAVWQSAYGANYNINVDTGAIDFYVNKPTLEYTIANKTKPFGEFDPVFTFTTITGNRTSDFTALQDLLDRTSATQDNENAGSSVIIELNPHLYYDYTPNTATLTITRKVINIVPNSFEVTYGTADFETRRFTVTKDYTAYTPLSPEGIELLMSYSCLVSSLNAGPDYIHDITGAAIDDSDPNRGNFTVNLTNGLDKIRIVPRPVSVDLTPLDTLLTKVYDGDIFKISLKDESSFDYYNNLPGLLTPEQIEESSEYVDLTAQLAYQERIFYALIGGYKNNVLESMIDRTMVGSKLLVFDTIYLATWDDIGDIIQCSLDNYYFDIPTEGEITQKEVQIDTTPNSETYKKTYDGEALTVAFDPLMPTGLVSGHYFDAESLWLSSAETRAAVTAHALYLQQQTGGFVIYDAEGNQVQANYVISTTDFGGGTIEARKIKASIATDINHTYDGRRILIDLTDGNVYRTKGGTSELLMNKPIIYEYDTGNYNENTLGTVFVGTHTLSLGELITPTANALRSALVLNEEIDFSGTERTNYQILYANNIWASVAKRPLTVDVNELEELLSKAYDGTPYAVELDNGMADNLVELHEISGKRITFDGNVSLVEGIAQPKALNSSVEVLISDENTVNVASNYAIDFTERYATIYRRELMVDITLDSAVSKTKVFDNQPFVITLTAFMLANLAEGDALSQGTLATPDGNVYTLDSGDNIVYDGEEYADKIMQVSESIQIMRGVSNVTNNYNITLQNNNVAITQKPLSVDMTKDYIFLDFTYKGMLFEFPITNNMITGLISGHSVASSSSPLVSESQNVGEGINVIFPEGEVYIQDETFTHNYSFSFVPCQIEITKRFVEIDVSSTGLELSKVYDTAIFEVELSGDMDVYAGDPTRGLVPGHTFSGSAKSADGFAGATKSLIFQCDAISDVSGIPDYTANYNVIYTNISAVIEKRRLDININAELPEGHSKVYDETKLTVLITTAMLDGLQGDDYLVDSGDNMSFRRTTAINAGTYSIDSAGEGDIVIMRSGLAQNLSEN
ncbi:MAG: hypothetical protein PHC84_03710 [Clostridia bacterium]|nr:hypothetical protein [Clostridia bacterium]